MCAFGIYELRQYSTEILLLGRHGEQNAFGTHLPVETLDIGDGETQFDSPGWVLVRSWVQRKDIFAGHELAPARRFEFHGQTEHIARKLHGFVHVGNKYDRIP